MANEIQRFIQQIPPVTRCLSILRATLFAATVLQLISPLWLINSGFVFLKKGQLWRLVTAFFVAIGNPLSELIQLVFFHQYSLKLETTKFLISTADYVYYLFVIWGFTMVSLLYHNPAVYTSTLTNAMIYTWSQDSPDAIVTVLIFQVRAKYLPFLNIGMDFLVGGFAGAYASLIGLLAGHFYLFFDTIWPLRGGRRFLHTPLFLRRLIPNRPKVASTHDTPFTVYRSGRRLSSAGDDTSGSAGGGSAGSTASTGASVSTTTSSSRFQGTGHRLGS